MAEEGKTTFPNKQQIDRDLTVLSAVLQPRIEQARRGKVSTKSFEQIREGGLRRAGL